MATVELTAVGKRFGRHTVIESIDLTIGDGEFVVFVGPSGCGKSTLLRLVAGLEPVSAGTIRIGGADVTALPPGERGLAMVFQSYALYPHMTVERNIAFGLHRQRLKRAERSRRVLETARLLGLEPLLGRLPRELSGGQRQRVAIGRAMVREPRAFLFDEPLSNLDAALRARMRLEIARLHERLGTTMLYVTHDQIEAMTLADRIVVLDQGRIEQIGTPDDIYARPASRFVAGFIGSMRMNFLPARVVDGGAGGVRVQLAGGALVTVPVQSAMDPGEELTLGIRPEHLHAQAFDGAIALDGRIERIEAIGEAQLVYLEGAAGSALCARLAGPLPEKPGEALRLWLRSDQCHLFDERGRTLVRQP